MTLRTGGELAAGTLQDFGVEVALGLHGGHLDELLTGLRRCGVRLVDTRHEAAAVNSADGYARATGGLGVAFATAGSGFLNAVAGLGPAQIDRSPVLLLTSSPPMKDAESNTLQGSVDQVAVSAPLVKWAPPGHCSGGDPPARRSGGPQGACRSSRAGGPRLPHRTVPAAGLAEFAELIAAPVFHPGFVVGAMPPDHPLNGYSAARNLGALTGRPGVLTW
jgi:thiamine pyrophosphate-dependent acetolactate synthase large subunit-like protein